MILFRSYSVPGAPLVAALLGVVMSVLTITGATESNHRADVLLPDLAFQMECNAAQSREQIENDIEDFLRAQGFRVLNKGRIQREHNVNLLETDIVGLSGDRRRETSIIKLPHTAARYAVGTTSAPPTSRDARLEDSLIAFARDTLKCDLRQIARHENGPEPAAFFERDVERIEGLFREADELSGKHKI